MRQQPTVELPLELYTTINDPEGVLAADLAWMITSDTSRALRCTVSRVPEREDAHRVLAVAGATGASAGQVDAYYVRTYVPNSIRRFEGAVNDWRYPNPVVLNFDPDKLDDEQMTRIWSDPLARACWIGLRYRRLVSQHFKDIVEWFAEEVRDAQRQGTLSRAWLRLAFSKMDGVIGQSEERGILAAALYPYLAGEKTFEYIVRTAEDNAKLA